MTVWYQRVVGAEFLFNTFCFEYALNAQHFLNLVTDGFLVFKVKPGVLAQRELTIFLVGHDFSSEVGALRGVFLKAPQIISGQMCCHVRFLGFWLFNTIV